MGLNGIFLRNTMSRGILRAETAFGPGVEAHVLEVAIDALEFAKEQASWEDRTGDAREGLDTDVSREGNVIVWELFHTVSYGKWLETIQNGRFAVIMPTLELFAPHIGKGLTEVGGTDYADGE
jgi:hypothetical protein